MHSEVTENYKIARRVTLVGMALDIVLGVVKIFIGIISFSYALVADGVHSLSDVITDIFVLVITKISYHEPDDEHPYGHARFETLGTVLLGGILIAIAIILAYENFIILMTREILTPPAWPALVVAGLSIVSKEWIYHYTRKAGEKLKSNILIANAWHSRTDAFSSIVVLAGVSGAMLGYYWLDAFAAILVAIIVGKIGGDLVWDSLKELVDTGLGPKKIAAIKNLVLAVEGVRGAYDLRTRKMGTEIFLDLHILVSPDISVSEGHMIGEWVSKKLREEFSAIKDIIYHIDTEEDCPYDAIKTKKLLPLRSQIIEQTNQCWEAIPEYRFMEKMTIHYQENGIVIEFFLACNPDDSQLDLKALKQQLKQTSRHLGWLKDIRIWQGSKQD